MFIRLQKYKFYLKLCKYQFFFYKVTFFCHGTDHQGIYIAIEELKKVYDWLEPKTVSQVREFLGFVNFFHYSLYYLAKISEPLTRLIHKDMRW